MPPPSRPQVLSISPASADGSRSAPHNESTTPGPRWVQTFIALSLAAVIIAAIAIAVLFAVVHARDRYWINIASGSWIALARQADHGVLYPPLRDAEGAFAGTRYMPLHIMLHAGLSRVTHEWLLSGRIIGFASALMWTLGIAALARVRRCPWLIAGALAASALASPTGVQALCSIRSDGLALALQLWALWFVARSPRPASGALAGILVALAFLAKLTAVWAALAIVLWLLWRSRAGLLAFVVSGAVVAGGALFALDTLTDGRMLENFTNAGASGWTGWGSVLLWSQQRMLGFVSDWSPTTWVLVPPAALTVLLAAGGRDLNVLHLAWIACCATMAVMFADIGVGENHIIELAAITAVVAGDLWHRTAAIADSQAPAQSSIPPRWNAAQLLIAMAVGWSSVAVIKQRLWPDVERTIEQWRSDRPSPDNDPRALDSLLAGARFFSDDPTLAILLDRKPMISDAFIFRGFEATHPEWIDEVIARIAAREFDFIVLTREGDPDSWWYRELFLGPRVMHAIRESCELQEQRAGYWVYRRRPRAP